MVRVLGIDPGTYSFDLVVLEDGRVVAERSILTSEVAKKPSVLVEAVESLGEVDLIAGPSGYGVPLTYNSEIRDPRRFAVEVLLLSTEDALREGLRRGVVGIYVYEALARIVEEFWRRRLKVCYIPSVILLPTVPGYRKINRVDMGTADKMAIAVSEVARRHIWEGRDLRRISFILVEMGYGYNAVMAVKGGRIVDGLGGTMAGPGFLTIGPVDAELTHLVGSWSREDVFYGGVATVCGTENPEEALLKRERLCREAFKAMIESTARAAASMAVLNGIDEILLSGRLTRIDEVRKMLVEVLENIADVGTLPGLPGATLSKRAAQGYAVVADGVAGGLYKDVVVYMGVLAARGTVLDNVYHPKAAEAKLRVRRAYAETVVNPKL